uniref:Uncharacterized protein n=1 Tax=Setaria viridis TaxID=4556 RepID=A0A4U6T8R9_SETVI|nr:hypothetical protein SEVIR_9G549900v2 [Setaria viridis]
MSPRGGTAGWARLRWRRKEGGRCGRVGRALGLDGLCLGGPHVFVRSCCRAVRVRRPMGYTPHGGGVESRDLRRRGGVAVCVAPLSLELSFTSGKLGLGTRPSCVCRGSTRVRGGTEGRYTCIC